MPSSMTDRYVETLRQEFPTLHILNKGESPTSRAIDRFFKTVSFGRYDNYSQDFTTTLGTTIYVPSVWNQLSDEERYLTLRHEAVHMRQFRRFGWVGMALLYLIPIFPIGLAIGRAYLEWEAYKETLTAIAQIRGIEAANDEGVKLHIVRQFVSGAYGWMWPFPGYWYRRVELTIQELRRKQVEL